MTDCTFTKIEFPSCCKRRVEADFAGGEISSNGGALLLSLADRRVGLLSGLGRRLEDRRQAGKVKHGLAGLLRQRVFALALGDEDVNDHEVLRDDLVLQTACGGDRRLASPSTVGRLERAADRSWAWAAHETLVESFIASYDEAPEELVLDFDCTDDAVHGRQEGRLTLRETIGSFLRRQFTVVLENSFMIAATALATSAVTVMLHSRQKKQPVPGQRAPKGSREAKRGRGTLEKRPRLFFWR